MIKNLITSSVALMISFSVVAKDHDMSVGTSSSGDSVACFTMISENGLPCIILDPDDQKGVGIAVNNFAADLRNVSGKMPVVSSEVKGPKAIIVGTLDSKFIRQLAKEKKIDVSGLKGKTEQYLITFVDNPMPGVEEAVVMSEAIAVAQSMASMRCRNRSVSPPGIGGRTCRWSIRII